MCHKQPVCAATAADDATGFLEEVSINKQVLPVNVMGKKHSLHIVDGCSAGIHIMVTRDSSWPPKHGQIKYWYVAEILR